MTIRLAVVVTLEEAEAIAGKLSQTSKMPGKSYGVDAFACQRGGELARIPGSTCHDCYARRNFYAMTHVRALREHNQIAIKHPRWADAMTVILHELCADDTVFRWHDSGDLAGAWHLGLICDVARRTPWLDHWLPTRESAYVVAFLDGGGVIPPNLNVRVSADYVGGVPPFVPGTTTSTVHLMGHAPVKVGARRRDSIECKAHTRDHQCGPCRACWSPEVKNVSYPKTGTKAPQLTFAWEAINVVAR